MTILVLMAGLVLADAPPPVAVPAPGVAAEAPAPTAEELYILLLKQRMDELKRRTAVAEAQYRLARHLLGGLAKIDPATEMELAQYKLARHLLGGVEVKWADAVISHYMRTAAQASVADGRAWTDHFQAQQAALDRQDAQRDAQWDLRSKVFKQRMAIYDAHTTLCGLRTIANHFIDPFAERLLGRGQSLIPFPEVPPLPDRKSVV